MTRDWELIRQILLRLHESATPNTVVSMKDFKGENEQSVAYNMRLLHESSCIEANIKESNTGNNLIDVAIARRLTPRGHDLLDSISNESVWSQVKDRFKARGVEMTVDLVIGAGKRVMASMLDL